MSRGEAYYGDAIQSNFIYIIEHLNRKKPKKGENGYFGKPLIKEEEFRLFVKYNYYCVFIEYDPDNKRSRPSYCPYGLHIEKPCVIQRGGSQELGTAFSDSWWHSQEDLWLELQQKWAKVI